MKKEEKETKQFDTKLYDQKLRKANRQLKQAEKQLMSCKTSEMEEFLREYRRARLKVEQLHDRLAPPVQKFDLPVYTTNEQSYDS